MTGIDIAINAIDNASKIIEGVGNTSGRVAQNLEKNWVKIGIATAAAGVAIEAMARKQGVLTEQTKKVAASLGMQEKEVRKLVLSLSDVSTPIEEVLALMELGRQQGLKSIKQLEGYVNFWDMVADASGEAAGMLADAGISIHAVGIAAGEEGQALAAFGYIIQETTASIPEFLNFLALAGPELRSMGADINDAAAILGILEQEFGLAGRRGIAMFRQAVNESGGDLEKMLSLLGISKEVFDEYSLAVENSSDVIARNAKIHEESFTIMQKLQSWAADITYKYGDLVTVISALTPLLITIGPIIKGVAVAKHLWAIAMEHTAIAAYAADIALAPLLGTIVAIGTIVLGLANRLAELTNAFLTNETAAMSWNDKILEIINIVLLGIPEILSAIGGLFGLPKHEFKYGYGAMIEGHQYGGTIPGPIGKPRLAIVHGGEEINNPYMGGSENQKSYTVQNYFQISELVVREEADVERVAERLLIMQKQKLAGVGVR